MYDEEQHYSILDPEPELTPFQQFAPFAEAGSAAPFGLATSQAEELNWRHLESSQFDEEPDGHSIEETTWNESSDEEMEWQEREEPADFPSGLQNEELFGLETNDEDALLNEEEMHDDEILAREQYELFFDSETGPPPILPSEAPMPLPERNPLPFAPLPITGAFWPVLSTHPKGREVAYQSRDGKIVGNSSRRFLTHRNGGNRYHAGIDLYANNRDKVVACEDGVIVNFYHFYRGTYCLLVEHPQMVINYGEVAEDSLSLSGLKVGDAVRAGQPIGVIGKMSSSSMLHFETYIRGTKENKRFMVGGRAPHELLNPTQYLLHLQANGRVMGSRASSTGVVAQSDGGFMSAIKQGILAGATSATVSTPSIVSTLPLESLKSVFAMILTFTDERNPDKLTDKLFFSLHPERGGRAIDGNAEKDAVMEWRRLKQEVVIPVLQGKGVSTANSSAAHKPAKGSRPTLDHYIQLWRTMVVRPEWTSRADSIVSEILRNQMRYEKIVQQVKQSGDASTAAMPWWFIAVIHSLETSLNFNKHLHNGDSLKNYTHNVPAGRPKVGHGPPFTFEESAQDALVLKGFHKKNSWTLPEILARLEQYNGFGNYWKGINTPYLWSGSNQYSKGKFVADHKWDPNAASAQVGAAVLIKRLIERGAIQI